MKYFEKTAFRFNKPGYIKKFNLFTEREISRALLRQGTPTFGIIKKIYKKRGLGEFGSTRAAYNFLVEKPSGEYGTAATIFSTPKGKSIAINKDFWRHADKKKRREILSHEAFHANVPILGQSEILAHIYGGAKSEKAIKESLKGGAKGLKHLIKTAPETVALETGLVAAPILATIAAIEAKKTYSEMKKIK
jgi:hypothetical protein